MEALSKRERERERVKRRLHNTWNDIISVENLLSAWREFLRGKRKRKDVAGFSLRLTDNIFLLNRELKEKTYRHGPYFAFKINDPKPRDIHKASVRDRLVHHAIYRMLYPYFDRKFIFDSYSCRLDKGVHRAINQFREYGRTVSRNHTRTVWILKCDIRKFFANIHHEILKDILEKYIQDTNVIWLLWQVINSFQTAQNIGLPLGNLTSQLLVNIYMNEFDQFLKRKLKIRYCVRYADDFVILHENKVFLENLIPKISRYLEMRLKLSLHSDKVFIKTFASGIDFLGWVHFPAHRVLRTTTKRRMMKRLIKRQERETVASYRGLLRYGNTHKIRKNISFA